MNLRRAWHTALWGARAYPGSTALLLGTSAITVGVTLPSLWLGAGRMQLPAATDPVLPFGLSAFAGTPASMQAQGIDAIAGLLVALGVAALAVGVATAGSLAAGRAAGRRPEISVRRAVGAARSSLRLAGLVEGLLLAAAAIGVGLVPALGAARWASATWPGTLVPALAAAAAAALAVGVVLLFAALAGVRAPGGTRVPHRGASSHGLVIPVFQFGVSLAILMGAARTGIRARELVGVRARVAGQAPVTATVYPIDGHEATGRRAERYAALIRALKARHRDLVSLSSAGALVGLGPVDFVTTDCGRCSEGGIYTPLRPVPAVITAMSADTFRAIGLPVLRGRGLADTDRWSAPRVAVVSATLAARDFENGVAVGRRILVGRGDAGEWYRVVGVVPDRIGEGIGGALAPKKAVYLSALQAPPAHADLLVSGPASSGLSGPSAKVNGAISLSALKARQGAPLLWFGGLTEGSGWAVLIIALAGMFAVMERWVTAVGPELAVRRAVGARRAAIIRFVLVRAFGVALWGAGAGLLFLIVVSGALDDAFPGLPAWSWPASLRVGVGLLAATTLGALVPAWGVIRAHPAAKAAELD